MISVASTVGRCDEFFDGNKQAAVSIVITPLRVAEMLTSQAETDKLYRIYWGCSKHFHCHNESCEFAFKTR